MQGFVKVVVEALLRHDVSGLPVVDDRGGLVGIVTEADLGSKEAYGTQRRWPVQVLVDVLTGDTRRTDKAKGLTAESVMTPRPFALGPVVHRRRSSRLMTNVPGAGMSARTACHPSSIE